MKKIIIIVDDNGEVEIQKEELIEKDEFVEEEVKPHVSMYARFFDESCVAWNKDPEYSLMFLRQQMLFANEKLKYQGYLFLNDVYDMLGMPRTKAGQIIGWVYNENNTYGDNYVDFGIYDEHNRNFVNGYENTVLLDFNVDGNILDHLPGEKGS